MKTIEIPGSKSYTNRALLIAALAKGKTILKKVLVSDDTTYMIQALRACGVAIVEHDDSLVVYGGKIKAPKDNLFVGNAGTAMRFLTTFASLVPGRTVITGSKRMHERPIQDLLDGLSQLGVNATSQKKNRCPPVVVDHDFDGGKCIMNGSNSSQYFSSILLSAPYAKKDVEIDVKGELASKPYIDVTIEIMKNFGVKVVNKNYKKFIVKHNQKYKARSYTIEGDASNASYFLAAGAIMGKPVRVTNINSQSKQGDIHFADVLRKMGCTIKKGKNWIEVRGEKLKAITIDMNAMPDIVQTLSIVALFAKGTTKIKNVPNLRIKETDRIHALATELRKIGAQVKENKDGLEITPGIFHGASIDTYDDHRMAMSFAIAGLKINHMSIQNPFCVRKSFPNFWEIFETLLDKPPMYCTSAEFRMK